MKSQFNPFNISPEQACAKGKTNIIDDIINNTDIEINWLLCIIPSYNPHTVDYLISHKLININQLMCQIYNDNKYENISSGLIKKLKTHDEFINHSLKSEILDNVFKYMAIKSDIKGLKLLRTLGCKFEDISVFEYLLTYNIQPTNELIEYFKTLDEYDQDIDDIYLMQMYIYEYDTRFEEEFNIYSMKYDDVEILITCAITVSNYPAINILTNSEYFLKYTIQLISDKYPDEEYLLSLLQDKFKNMYETH